MYAQVQAREADADGVVARPRRAPARRQRVAHRTMTSATAKPVALIVWPLGNDQPPGVWAITSGLVRANTSFMIPLTVMLSSVAAATNAACRYSRANSRTASAALRSTSTAGTLPVALDRPHDGARGFAADDGPSAAGSRCPRTACPARPRRRRRARTPQTALRPSGPAPTGNGASKAGSAVSRRCPATTATTAMAASRAATTQPQAATAIGRLTEGARGQGRRAGR